MENSGELSQHWCKIINTENACHGDCVCIYEKIGSIKNNSFLISVAILDNNFDRIVNDVAGYIITVIKVFKIK